MSAARSDALVFFGAMGEKIFPALQRMIGHGSLDVRIRAWDVGADALVHCGWHAPAPPPSR